MKAKVIAIITAALFGLTGLLAPSAYAVNVFTGCENSGVNCSVVKDNSLDYNKSNNRVWNVISVALSILAGVSVIMVVIGGIRYATSMGDASKVQGAKNTILYAVVGLIVALVATAVVSLVNNYFG